MFLGAKIGGNARFDSAKIKNYLNFEITKFKNPEAQEESCRNAKRIYERLGNKADADYHFYREMEVRRKQKNPIIRFLELPVQYIFGYVEGLNT